MAEAPQLRSTTDIWPLGHGSPPAAPSNPTTNTRGRGGKRGRGKGRGGSARGTSSLLSHQDEAAFPRSAPVAVGQAGSEPQREPGSQAPAAGKKLSRRPPKAVRAANRKKAQASASTAGVEPSTSDPPAQPTGAPAHQPAEPGLSKNARRKARLAAATNGDVPSSPAPATPAAPATTAAPSASVEPPATTSAQTASKKSKKKPSATHASEPAPVPQAQGGAETEAAPRPPTKRQLAEQKRAQQEAIEQAAEAAAKRADAQLAALLDAVPGHLATQERFQAQLEVLLSNLDMRPEVRAARELVRMRVEDAINRVAWDWGDKSIEQPHLEVREFGSSVFGLSSNSADLDLVLFDAFRPQGVTLPERRRLEKVVQIYKMRLLAMPLRKVGFTSVVPIAGAKVPLVRFAHQTKKRTIECDLNVNDRFGYENSRMLAHYFTLLPSARPVAFFIKQWSKKRGLNDPSGSGGFVTLSSYSLVLLFVSYLQKKGLLPHLQAPQEDASPRKLLRGTLAQAFKNEDRPVDWDVSWSRLDPGLWRPDSPSAHELAAGFFEYYGSIFDASSDVVAIHIPAYRRPMPFQPPTEASSRAPHRDRSHKSEPPPQFSPPGEATWPPSWSSDALITQDPFLRNRNTSSNVALIAWRYIAEEMRRAAVLLRQSSSITQVCERQDTDGLRSRFLTELAAEKKVAKTLSRAADKANGAEAQANGAANGVSSVDEAHAGDSEARASINEAHSSIDGDEPSEGGDAAAEDVAAMEGVEAAAEAIADESELEAPVGHVRGDVLRSMLLRRPSHTVTAEHAAAAQASPSEVSALDALRRLYISPEQKARDTVQEVAPAGSGNTE